MEALPIVLIAASHAHAQGQSAPGFWSIAVPVAAAVISASAAWVAYGRSRKAQAFQDGVGAVKGFNDLTARLQTALEHTEARNEELLEALDLCQKERLALRQEIANLRIEVQRLKDIVQRPPRGKK